MHTYRTIGFLPANQDSILPKLSEMLSDARNVLHHNVLTIDTDAAGLVYITLDGPMSHPDMPPSYYGMEEV